MTVRKFTANRGIDVRGLGVDSSTGSLDLKTANVTRLGISAAGALTVPGVLNFTNTGDATSATTGAVVVTGGIGVGGSIFVSGNVSGYSDRRLKEDIEPITNPLIRLKGITGVTYTRIKTQKRETGVIAQDVQAVLPEAVAGEDFLAVAYGNLVGLVIEAIKELSDKVDVIFIPYQTKAKEVRDQIDVKILEVGDHISRLGTSKDIDQYLVDLAAVVKQPAFPYYVEWPEVPWDLPRPSERDIDSDRYL